MLISMQKWVFAVSHKNGLVYDILVNIFEFGTFDFIITVSFSCSMVLVYLEMYFPIFNKNVLYPFHINTQARTTKCHPYVVLCLRGFCVTFCALSLTSDYVRVPSGI